MLLGKSGKISRGFVRDWTALDPVSKLATHCHAAIIANPGANSDSAITATKNIVRRGSLTQPQVAPNVVRLGGYYGDDVVILQARYHYG